MTVASPLLKQLYPFLRGKPPSNDRLDSSLLESVMQKAADSKIRNLFRSRRRHCWHGSPRGIFGAFGDGTDRNQETKSPSCWLISDLQWVYRTGF